MPKSTHFTYLLNIDMAIFCKYRIDIVLKLKTWYRSITNVGDTKKRQKVLERNFVANGLSPLHTTHDVWSKLHVYSAGAKMVCGVSWLWGVGATIDVFLQNNVTKKQQPVVLRPTPYCRPTYVRRDYIGLLYEFSLSISLPARLTVIRVTFCVFLCISYFRAVLSTALKSTTDSVKCPCSVFFVKRHFNQYIYNNNNNNNNNNKYYNVRLTVLPHTCLHVIVTLMISGKQ